MNQPRLHIARLKLRVPGNAREDGQALASALRERLAELGPGLSSQHLGLVRIRIPSPSSADHNPARLADSIATSLQQRLSSKQASSHA